MLIAETIWYYYVYSGTYANTDRNPTFFRNKKIKSAREGTVQQMFQHQQLPTAEFESPNCNAQSATTTRTPIVVSMSAVRSFHFKTQS